MVVTSSSGGNLVACIKRAYSAYYSEMSNEARLVISNFQVRRTKEPSL